MPGKLRKNSYKVCSRCGENKNLTRFTLKVKRGTFPASDPRGYRPECNDCRGVRNARVADPNWVAPEGKTLGRPRIHENAAQQKRCARRRARILCLRYAADKGCQKCGERDPRLLEFDHLDPSTKSFTIAQILSKGYAWSSEALRQEVRKCRILCSNCHRLHTIEQQGYYSHPEVKAELQELFKKYDIEE